jgi:hypothetical protein
MRARASPSFPSATGEVDGGMALDGDATRAHEAARDWAECLAGRSSAGRAGHAEETSEHALYARERAGKREHTAVALNLYKNTLTFMIQNKYH